MPFDYDRDDARRHLVITFRGEFLVTEVVAMLERIRADGTWSYPVLYDLRDLKGHPTLDDLRQIMSVQDGICRHDAIRPGPAAFLVIEPSMYGRACAYASLARSVVRFEVFRVLDEAREWLATHSALSGGAV